ncbi:MAG: hypothetical protein B6U89_03855 [Desulfurococcales archaeon ex4484_58]|nr:MAG: hypothetical protein B6U89_03855 [Desulfurococcales archaeon ex4484_58]
MLKYISLALLVPLLVSLLAVIVSYFNPPPTESINIYEVNDLTYQIFTVTPNGEVVYLAISRDFSQRILGFTPTSGYRYELSIIVDPEIISYIRKVEDIKIYLIKVPQGTLLSYHGAIEWENARRIIDMVKYSSISSLSFTENRFEYFNLTSQLMGDELRIAYIITFRGDVSLSDIGAVYVYMRNLTLQTPVRWLVEKAITGNYTIQMQVNDILFQIERRTSRFIRARLISTLAPDIYTIARIAFIATIIALITVNDYFRNPDEYRFLRKIFRSRKTRRS